MRLFSVVSLTALIFLVPNASPAALITSWQIAPGGCDDQGCRGAGISLAVEDLGGNMYRVTQGLNVSSADSSVTDVSAVSMKVITGVSQVSLEATGGGLWSTPTINDKAVGFGCGGNGNGHVCTSETTGGLSFGDLADPNGWNYWVWKVTASGNVLDEMAQNYGLKFNDGDRGKLISASAPVPEPSAALVFAVGLGVVGVASRRRYSESH